MKKPFNKLLVTLVATLICVYIAGIMMIVVSGFVFGMNNIATTDVQAKSLKETIQLLENEEESATNGFYIRTRTNARLMAAMLKEKVVDGQYRGQILFEDGMVVKYTKGVLEVPQSELKPQMDASMFEQALDSNVYTTIRNEDDTETITIITAENIKDDYYYVDWTDQYELTNHLISSTNRNGVLSGIEDAYGGILLVADGNGILTYNTGEFYKYETLAQCGLNESNLKNNSTFNYNGNTYTVTYVRSDFTDEQAVLLLPIRSVAESISAWSRVFTSLTLLIVITAVVYNYAVQKLVFNNVLSEEQEKKYHPKKVKIVNAVVAFIGVIAVLLSVSFVQSMSSLYDATQQGRSALNILEKEVDDRDLHSKMQMELSQGWYIYYGENIAALLAENPQLLNRDKFEEFKDTLGIVYLMAYDENGKEICSSNDFKNFELGTSPEDPSTDFRRLLHGIDSIVHDVSDDEYTGLRTQLIGVKIPFENTETYGALILALYPYQAGMDVSIVSYDDRLRTLAVSGDIMMIVDKESGVINNCNLDNFVGYNISAYDINGKESFNSLMNYFMINGSRYYGLAKEDGGQIYFNFLSSSRVSQSSFLLSLISALFFLLVYGLAMYLINRGYSEKEFEENVLVGAPVIRGSRIEIETTDGRKKSSVDPSKRFAFIPELWREMLPERKAVLAFDIMISVFLLQIIYYVYIKRTASDSLLGFIMQGKWSRGLNLFAFTSIIILVAGVSLAMLSIKFIIYMLIMTMDTKGETVCRLVYNLLQYVSFITVLYYAFGYLGFDTSGLLASVGLMTLAVSLGSKDLVADILAGLTIVFEGEYQVGDMVEIGGYRGKVQEIGIRSTKLIGRGDNIKIIGNRDVKNVLNMTRLNSWLPIEITIPSSESLDQIEAILDEQLPQIGKQIKEVIRGPYYYGVLSINNGNMTLSILTECKEEDYHKVQRKLNKELLNLFKRNKITMS